MRVIKDYRGRNVRLSDERLNHILEHPEMAGMEEEIENTLIDPEYVIQSRSDNAALLYYRFYRQTQIGDKWLSVVVKYSDVDAFVVTSYLTNRLLQGEILWQKNESQ